MASMPDMISTHWIVWGIVLFLMKHLLADFVLQSSWIAGGKQQREGWLAPLTVHVSLHAALTGLILLILAPGLVWLALVDFVVHFTIDRTKVIIEQRYEFKASQARYWWLFGTDQTLHHLTHLGFAVILAANKSM